MLVLINEYNKANVRVVRLKENGGFVYTARGDHLQLSFQLGNENSTADL